LTYQSVRSVSRPQSHSSTLHIFLPPTNQNSKPKIHHQLTGNFFSFSDFPSCKIPKNLCWVAKIHKYT
jgi:hypothetical protein